MKRPKYSLFVSSILFAIIAIQFRALAVGYPKPSTSEQTAVPTSQPAKQQSVTVKIENFTFEPRELQIAVGTTVTWQNADDVPHTATSKDDPQTFDSGALDTDDKFSFTFSKPGKYAYYCKVHPHMQGVITVK
jgi:plastocyanin